MREEKAPQVQMLMQQHVLLLIIMPRDWPSMAWKVVFTGVWLVRWWRVYQEKYQLVTITTSDMWPEQSREHLLHEQRASIAGLC